jgi:hypothetical protein
VDAQTRAKTSLNELLRNTDRAAAVAGGRTVRRRTVGRRTVRRSHRQTI